MQSVTTSSLKNRVPFALALVLYAFFGSPTPDVTGWAEIAVLILLAVSVRPFLAGRFSPAIAFLIYGATIPLLVTMIHGYELREILRDIIPFAFLMMPILYVFRQEKDMPLLTLLVAGIGVVFSVRTLISFGPGFLLAGTWSGPPDLLYLANSPEVLFSAVLLLHAAFFAADRTGTARIACFCLAGLNLLAMSILKQRASLAFIALCGLTGFLSLFWKSPRSALRLAWLCLPVFIIAGSFIGEVCEMLSFKTRIVGINARGAEWKAVFGQVSASPLAFLFGRGWGAEFENPAVGGLRVSFTHSLLSSLLLKTGVTGLVLFLAYGFDLSKTSWGGMMRKPVFLFALGGPLLIGLCLYASYKSLGYGLLLLLLASFQKARDLNSLEGLCDKNPQLLDRTT